MSDLLSIGLSGINASRNRALEAANNISKIGTEHNKDVNLAKEMVNLSSETNLSKANAAVIKTGDEITKTTIDLLA